MKTDTFIRIFAGIMVLVSAALTYFVSPWWLLFTCFIGINLIQSAITGFCLPSIVLTKLGWINEDGLIQIGGSKSR